MTGTGVFSGPNASLSAAGLVFATQVVGTTSPGKMLTLTNYGTMTLDMAISVRGDFSQSNTCGQSLPAGAKCAITVIFKPTQRGTRTGELSISDNAPRSPQVVSLIGTGSVVELIPTSLTFLCSGFPPIRHCTPSQTITLNNVGSTPLSIVSITITGPFSQTNTCHTSVAAETTCTITITWSHATGSGAVSVTDNGGGSPQSVALTGVNVFP